VELIRKGSDHAIVEGLFEIGDLPWVRERLVAQGFMDGEAASSLVIRRTLHHGGKNRVYVNGQLCSLQQLQHITDGLIDFCSQHEHQTLMRPSVQQDVLDGFGALSSEKAEVQKLSADWKSACDALDASDRGSAERVRKMEFIRFQLDEISRAELVDGEEAALGEERRQISQVGLRKQSYEDAALCLSRESRSDLSDSQSPTPVDALRTCEQKLSVVDPELAQHAQRLRFELEELNEKITGKLAACEISPERREWVEERLFLLQNLKRKYGPDLTAIFAMADSLRTELQTLETLDQPRPLLVKQKEDLEVKLAEAFARLLRARRRHAEKLSQAIARELRDLCIDKAAFQVEVREVARFSSETEFLIRTNAGEDLQPLQRVASGGELSRVMLAIRRVCKQDGRVGVYLFDEIDAGLGGTIAYHVGMKLKQVAESHQILCVTHLPQVAAFADTHLHVVKTRQGDRTISQVQTLHGELRVGEVARMMSGKAPTAVALANAKELLASTIATGEGTP
jgi:DNA repair protein RecN (Recombination protein N)